VLLEESDPRGDRIHGVALGAVRGPVGGAALLEVVRLMCAISLPHRSYEKQLNTSLGVV
jgi:hypothetical protein